MPKKKNEIKTASVADLDKLVAEKREALRLFRFGVAGSKVKNVKEGSALKKEIARILTERTLRKKEGRDRE
ncbi:MAG: 50S ribosomal protein L29 [Patescibacteria group bacterium]